MVTAKVFFSWQSDLARKTNHSLIEDALNRSTRKIRADNSLGVEPVVDRDTQGVPGAPEIHAAILGKIQESDAAVFDVSFVHSGNRFHPNPNVLIELGYALGTIGWERVILVFNDKHGAVEDLPFDIRGKRAIKYSMAVEDEPAVARNQLTQAFEERLRDILTQHPRKSTTDVQARAIEDLHNGKPGAVRSLRAALSSIEVKLAQKPQSTSPNEALHLTVVRNFSETSAIVAQFAELLAIVVDVRGEAAFQEILGSIERLASTQSLAVAPGSSRLGDFDVQRLVVREILTLTTAACLNRQNWAYLRILFSHQFRYRHEHRERLERVGGVPSDLETIRDFENEYSLGRGEGIGRILRDRYIEGIGGFSFADLREADFFIHMAEALAEGSQFCAWVPVLFPYGPRPQSKYESVGWVQRLRGAGMLEEIATAIGITSDSFRAKYSGRWTDASTMFTSGWPFLRYDLNWVLVKPEDLGTQL